MPKKGYYSADAIIGRARVQAEQQAAERAKKPEVQPEQEIQDPGTDFKLPTPNQTEQVLPDVKDWDYKTAQTDMQGNPLKTREFMGAEITPKGFDPNGNPYFGGGVKGWLQKWGYKLSEESATDKEADLAWDTYLDTAKQFSENFINGFKDQPQTQEEKTAIAKQQGGLFIEGVKNLFDAGQKKAEASKGSSILTPILRVTNAAVGMTLDVFQAISELPEKGLGAERAMREYANDNGSILPNLSADDDGETRVGAYGEAIDTASRLFLPALQAYDTVRFWTAPGTFKEKTAAIKAGWVEGQMLYSELVQPTIRNEFEQRVKAGEDPYLLTMELENPWVEMAGEMILDPLNLIGAFGKAERAGSAISEAVRVTEKTGALADVNLAGKIADLGKISTDAQASTKLEEIVDDIINIASDAGRRVDSAQGWKMTELTPVGNKFKHHRTVGNYLSNAVQAIRNTGGNSDDVMDYVVALVKRASGNRDDVKAAMATISHSPLGNLSYNQAAFETGHILRNLLGDGDSLIKAIKNTNGDWSELRKILDEKIVKSLDFAFPSVNDMSKAADKVKELAAKGEKIDPKTAKLAEKYAELAKTNPGVVKWAGVQNLVAKALQPINGFLANNYFSLSYGYATRNFIQNMVTLWADNGIDLKNGAVAITKNGFATPKLDDFLIKQFGEIPVALRGKTLTESVTEGSLMKQFFDKFNKFGFSPAALADFGETYASKMIFTKYYKQTMDNALQLGAALPDAATWNKAGFTTEQANDFVNLIKANDYDEAAAIVQFNQKYGDGTVDKWKMLDWVDPNVKKGLEEYEDYWKQIVNLTNKPDAKQSEILDYIDNLKQQVRERANKVTSEPVRIDQSDPIWRGIADASEQAGKYANKGMDNQMLALKVQFDRSAADLNEAMKTAAFHLKQDPAAGDLVDEILEFTSDTRRQLVNEKAAKETAEKQAWAWDLTKKARKNGNPAALWDEAVLGPAPANVSSENLLQAVWDNYRNTRQSVWGAYFKTYVDKAQSLAKQTGLEELFAKANKSLLELEQYRNYVYNDKGIFTKVPKFSPSVVGDTANGNNVRKLAGAYGFATATKDGMSLDKKILAIINKASGTDYTKIDDVPLDVAEQAIAKYQGHEVKGFFTKDSPVSANDLQRVKDKAKAIKEANATGTSAVAADQKEVQAYLDNKALAETVITMNGKPPQGWRKMIAGETDEFRKADVFRAVADASKSDSELADVLNMAKGAPQESQIAWAVLNNPNASDATRLLASKNEAMLANTSDEAVKTILDKYNPPSFTPAPVTEGLPVPPPRDPNVPPVGHVHSETKQGMLDALDHVQKGIAKRWGFKTSVGSDMEAMKNLVNGVTEKMTFARSRAQIVAEKYRDFALLPYGETKNMDFALSLVYPYQFWYTRSYSNWMKRAFMTNPEIISRYANLKEAMSQEQKDLPDWWKSQLNVSKLFGVETDNPIYINLEATVWPLYGLTGTDFNDPAKRTNWFTSMLDDMGKFGPSMWAPIQWGVAAYYAMNGQKDIASKWGSRAIPLTSTIKAASSYFGTPIELDPNVQLFSGEGLFDFKAADPYEEGRISRALAAMANEGIPEEQLIEAARTHEGPLWEEAYQRATQQRAPGQLASFFFGVGFKGRTADDVQTDQFYADYGRMQSLHSAGYMTDDQYKQGFNEMREKYPFMDVILLSRRAGMGRDAAYAYNVISRIPPGMTKEIYDIIGIDPETAQKFYDSGGKLEGLSETEQARFMAAMVDAGTMLAIPSNTTRREWTSARSQYSAMQTELKNQFGDDISDKISLYFGIDNTNEARAFLQQHPEVTAAMDAQTGYIANNPQLMKFYGGIDTLERYYTGLMYDKLEKEFGDNITALESEYFNLFDSAEKKVFLSEHPELKPYWEKKTQYKEENARQVVLFGNNLPEPNVELTGADPQNPTQQEIQDFAQPTPQVSFQEWEQIVGPNVSQLIQDYWYNGDDLPKAVIKNLDYMSDDYGYNSGQDMLQAILMSMQK